MVQASQARAVIQFEWSLGLHRDREKLLSSRQTKGTWCVVLGEAKLHLATGVAHHSRLQYSSFGRATVLRNCR